MLIQGGKRGFRHQLSLVYPPVLVELAELYLEMG